MPEQYFRVVDRAANYSKPLTELIHEEFSRPFTTEEGSVERRPQTSLSLYRLDTSTPEELNQHLGQLLIEHSAQIPMDPDAKLLVVDVTDLIIGHNCVQTVSQTAYVFKFASRCHHSLMFPAGAEQQALEAFVTAVQSTFSKRLITVDVAVLSSHVKGQIHDGSNSYLIGSEWTGTVQQQSAAAVEEVSLNGC